MLLPGLEICSITRVLLRTSSAHAPFPAGPPWQRCWGSLTSEGEAGASPGYSRAMVAMFVVGKWWLFFSRQQPIKAHRSAYHLATAAGSWLLQPGPGLGSVQGGVARDHVVAGSCGPGQESATPRTGILGGSSVPTHRVP